MAIAHTAKVPNKPELPGAGDFARYLPTLVRKFRDQVALYQSSGDPAERYSFHELAEKARKLADWLVESGIGHGDRVAILSESRPRWVVAYFAIVRAGAIVLPLDARLSVQELSFVLEDARPRLLLVSASEADSGIELKKGHSGIEYFFSLEPPNEAGSLHSIDTLTARNAHRTAHYQPEDPVVLTYTSGTMGRPKGVLTTSGNLMYQVKTLTQVMKNDENVVVVSILPLSHLFELTVGLLSVLYGGGEICYVNSLLPHEITRAMQEQQVTCMITVPLFLKLLRNGILKEVEKAPALRRWTFHVLYRFATRLPRQKRRLLFRPIHRNFGGCLDYFVCGGAPLESDVQQFFHRIGISVCEGYGMAETSPVISCATPEQLHPGTVGKPLPGLEVRIAGSNNGCGEILTRGPHVMKGYFRRADLTAELIDEDGWLHTGDIGCLDEHDYLSISGRSKNLVVLGSGKKVYPEELEEYIFEHPDIEEGCVLGVESHTGITAHTEEVCAVFVPSGTARELHSNDVIESHLKEIILNNSGMFATWKRPTRLLMRLDALPRTSTRKIKRLEVNQWVESLECDP